MAHQLAALNRPGNGEFKSVRNYLNDMKPVDLPERAYINHAEDLVTLRPGREHAWLDTVRHFPVHFLLYMSGIFY